MSMRERSQRHQLPAQWLPNERLAFGDGNRTVSPEDAAPLVESMGAIGQQVPAIVYPLAGDPCMHGVADGNHRLMAARILNVPLLCIVLEAQPSKIELRRLRLAVNNVHKHLTPVQVADEIDAHLAETGCTQDEAAEFFSISPGYVSRLLSPSKKLAKELHHLIGMKGVCRDVVRIVSALPTTELQKQLAERVLADVALHGKAKRDAIEREAARLKGNKTTRKAKDAKLKHDQGEVRYPGDWQHAKLIEWAAGLLKRLRQNPI